MCGQRAAIFTGQSLRAARLVGMGQTTGYDRLALIYSYKNPKRHKDGKLSGGIVSKRGAATKMNGHGDIVSLTTVKHSTAATMHLFLLMTG